MTKTNDFISKKRHEELLRVTDAGINYPQTKLTLDKALNSIIQKNLNLKYYLLAGGLLEGNEGIREANLFNTVFGRDSLIMLGFIRINQNEDVLGLEIREDVLTFLATYQGQITNPNSEQEPGKIIHEYRNKNDNIALELNKERGLEFPYYGAIDSSFYFIKELVLLLQEKPELRQKEYINHISNKLYTLENSLMMALDYCCSLCNNQDGLIWYQRSNKMGIEIQSWRDSYDSVSNFKGELPDFNKPLALLDIQAIAIEAFELASKYLKNNHLEEFVTKTKLGLESLWNSKKNCYNMGCQKLVDGSLLEFDTISSSNLLLLDKEYVPNQNKKLIFENCFNKLKVKNGIATIEKEANRFHQSGYHTGNVWLFDNVLCFISLQKYGALNEAKFIEKCIDRILLETNCYPELVGSEQILNQQIIDVYDHQDKRENRICQPGQPLQGWTVMAVLALKTLTKLA
jgi:glycogen debranching enzyme